MFCEIVAGDCPAVFSYDWDDALAFLPRADNQGRRGCTEGHVLVVPRVHVPDAVADYAVTGMVAARAAELGDALYGTDFHLINNCGSGADQTVFHLHWHIVPRKPGDGLVMPWTAQKGGAR